METDRSKMNDGLCWNLTISGRRYYPSRPNVDVICIEDIAWSLAHQCRYAGHTEYFYSVAQHSVYVSMACPQEHALWGLLHDAAEAYIQDLTLCLKLALPGYREIEERWERSIASRFELPWPRPAVVKHADLQVYAAECRDVRPSSLKTFQQKTEIEPPQGLFIEQWSVRKARDMFLERFFALIGGGLGSKLRHNVAPTIFVMEK